MTKRVALITGCSSGIGEATAARLVKGDWTVYATARKPETLEALATAGCKTLALDVTSEDSMAAAVDTVNREAGGVDALVNNAGYSQSGAAETLDLDDVRRQKAAVASIDANAGGPYGAFNAQVAKSTREVYVGPMRRLGGGPDAVAKVIEKSLDAKRPRLRYKVTPSASLSIASRQLLGARIWDAAMASQFPKPRPSAAER